MSTSLNSARSRVLSEQIQKPCLNISFNGRRCRREKTCSGIFRNRFYRLGPRYKWHGPDAKVGLHGCIPNTDRRRCGGAERSWLDASGTGAATRETPVLHLQDRAGTATPRRSRILRGGASAGEESRIALPGRLAAFAHEIDHLSWLRGGRIPKGHLAFVRGAPAPDCVSGLGSLRTIDGSVRGPKATYRRFAHQPRPSRHAAGFVPLCCPAGEAIACFLRHYLLRP